MKHQAEKELIVPELEALIGKKTKHYWSEKEVAILTKYWELNVPVADIAKYLGRTVMSVHNKAGVLGLTKVK